MSGNCDIGYMDDIETEWKNKNIQAWHCSDGCLKNVLSSVEWSCKENVTVLTQNEELILNYEGETERKMKRTWFPITISKGYFSTIGVCHIHAET